MGVNETLNTKADVAEVAAVAAAEKAGWMRPLAAAVRTGLEQR